MTPQASANTVAVLMGGTARAALCSLYAGRCRDTGGAWPDDLEVDDHGYPSDGRVDEIALVAVDDADRWLREVFPDAVRAMHYGRASVEPDPDGGQVITVTTGGWSGVEDVLGAVLEHPIMRTRLVEEYRGGKYVFRVPGPR